MYARKRIHTSVSHHAAPKHTVSPLAVRASHRVYAFCSPLLSLCADKYTLALVILFYLSILLPLVLLVGVCLCLPVMLVWMHFFSPKPGARPELISKLPKSVYRRPAGEPPAAAVGAPGAGGDGAGAAAGGSTQEECSICMAEYEDGEEIRDLPMCNHRFHLVCGQCGSFLARIDQKLRMMTKRSLKTVLRCDCRCDVCSGSMARAKLHMPLMSRAHPGGCRAAAGRRSGVAAEAALSVPSSLILVARAFYIRYIAKHRDIV